MTMNAAAPAPVATGPTLPRLLTALGELSGGPALPLAAHRRKYAVPPLPSRDPHDKFIAAVERAGLRGRGGAGFPTGRKLRTVSQGRGRPIVVVNGSEGEPASRKDELLMTRAPHLVLDGALLAAAAIGATDVFVGIDRAKHEAIDAIDRALHERARAGERHAPVHIIDLPARYVAGEETALVHLINGGEAKPTLTPPRPFEAGVDGRPTLVDNVETLCHLTQILRWGATWFRSQGTADEPGTILVTVSGAVSRGGTYEVPIGMPLPKVLAAAAPTSEVRAVLMGGYYGTWISGAAASEATLDNAHLRTLGSGLGCGAVIVLPGEGCGVRETARVLRWLAGETAGQCGPCVHGLAAIAGGMEDLATGRGTAQTVDRLQRWAGQIEGRGACSFPDGAVRLLRSALQVFARDIVQHQLHGPCAGSRHAPVLAIPHSGAMDWR